MTPNSPTPERTGWPEFLAALIALAVALWICLHEIETLERRVEALEQRWSKPCILAGEESQ